MDFESSVTTLDEVTREIKVEVPLSVVKSSLEESFTAVSKEAAVKGFRQGKAPRAILEKVYGARVRADVAQKLINSTLSSLADEHKLAIVGEPEIELSSFSEDKPMAYVAKVSLYPAPTVTGYDQFEVKVTKKEVNEEAINKVIDGLRTSKATMRRIELRTTAQVGDVVDLALVMQRGDEPKGRPEPVVVPLGEGHLPKEVDEGLVGLEIGQAREIQGAPQNDKPVLYTATLNSLYEKVLPELTDDFVKGAGVGVETVLELRMRVSEDLKEELEKQVKVDRHAGIIDQLVQRNEFKVPQVLIDDEIRNLISRSGIVEPGKVQDLDLEPFRAELAEVALKRVRGAIVLDRISEVEKIKVEKEEIESEIETLAARMGGSVDQVKQILSQQGRFMGYVMELTRDKVLQFLSDRCKVIEEPADTK